MKDVILRSAIFLFIFFHCFLASLDAVASNGKDDFEKIISTRKEELTGTKNNRKSGEVEKKVIELSKVAEEHWKSMDKLLWRTFLWNDVGAVLSAENLVANCNRLKILSQALISSGSKLEKNKQLKTDLVFAINWITKNQYNEEKLMALSMQQHNQDIIMVFSDLLIMLDKELPGEQKGKIKSLLQKHLELIRQKALPAERLQSMVGQILIAAITHRKDLLDSAVIFINKIGKYTVAEGTDVSTKPSMEDNGQSEKRSKIATLVPLAEGTSLLRGTSYQLPTSANEFVFTTILDAYLPFTFRNKFFDFEFHDGQPMNDQYKFWQLTNCLLKVSSGLSSPEAREVLKYMLQQVDVLELSNLDFKGFSLASSVLSDNKIVANSHIPNVTFIDQVKKVIVRRPSFVFATNTALNVSYLFDNVIAESDYHEQFRLPGRTVDISKKMKVDNPSSRPEWTGGVELEEGYVAMGMESKDKKSSLSYKKSWFVFDNEIVAMGNGIKAKDNGELETIVDNLQIEDKSEIRSNLPDDEDLETDLQNDVEWLLVINANDTLGRGFYFPLYQTVDIAKGSRIGNKSTKETEKDSVNEKFFFSIALNHGKKPTGSSYQFVTLPAFFEQQIRRYNSNPEVVILENNDKVHAVKETNLNIIGANFWTTTHAEVSVDGSFIIGSDCQAGIICIEKEASFELALSDPTLINTGTITIDLINKSLGEIELKDHQVEVTDFQGHKRVLFNVKDSNGRSLKVRFKIIRPVVETD